MISTSWMCPTHETIQESGQSYCQECIEFLDRQPDATTMSAEQRAGELAGWIELEILTIPIGRFQNRFEQLVGRLVVLHELMYPWPLHREIVDQKPATFDDVISKIPGCKKTIVVFTD